MDFDFELIVTFAQECPPLVTESDVEQIIKTLKNNKASDRCGDSAEHLKNRGEKVVKFITCVLNEIFRLEKALAEVRDTKTNLYAACIDASKDIGRFIY